MDLINRTFTRFSLSCPEPRLLFYNSGLFVNYSSPFLLQLISFQSDFVNFFHQTVLLKLFIIKRSIFSSDGHTRGVGFPYNYHNSFWSNYFANYWHPSSYYHQQLECPDPVPVLPGYYVSYDPLLAIPGPSDNIRSRSRQFYSSMVITRSYPAVNIWTLSSCENTK